MTTIAIGILLAVAVGAALLGSLGFLRLRHPLDRLHCVAFVNVVAGGALLAAALVSDGPSSRALKWAFCLVVELVSGAALSHATARALLLRGTITPDGRTEARR